MPAEQSAFELHVSAGAHAGPIKPVQISLAAQSSSDMHPAKLVGAQPALSGCDWGGD